MYLQRVAGNSYVSRVASDNADVADPVAIAERIERAAGRGNGLEGPLRSTLESALGADLSGLRIHTDSEANNLAESVRAIAFTSGSDIFFRDGAYDPDSPPGRQVLAHEAVHVTQQAAGPVSGTPTPDGSLAISDPSDPFELAAEAAAETISSASWDHVSAASGAEGSDVADQ